MFQSIKKVAIKRAPVVASFLAFVAAVGVGINCWAFIYQPEPPAE